MKKYLAVLLSFVTIPSYAQELLGALSNYQDKLEPSESTSSSSSSSSSSEVKPSSTSTGSSSKVCSEKDQTSMPLKYLTSLIQEKDGKLEFTYDQRTGKLKINSPDMIGNCSSMLEWTMKQPELEGKKSYALEVNFKKDNDCKEVGCSYQYFVMKDDGYPDSKEGTFPPTLKGFESCLKASGVVKDGKVDKSAIFNKPVDEKFDGLDKSGPILYLSHGPISQQNKAKYNNGKFAYQDECDFYELAHPQLKELLTYEDAEKKRLDEEANKLSACKVDEYGKLTEFIEKYESYSSQLGEVRDRLILEAAKKSAEAISSGKYTDEDLKVIADFDRYLVEPRIELAKKLYEESLELDGDAKKAKQDELVKVLAEISKLGKKPYFQSAHTLKLMKDGNFEDAEKLNSIKLSIENFQRLGAKQNNVVITTAVASQRVAEAKYQFKETIEQERERYEYRTGQTTGKSDYYANLARRMRNNIQTRTQNFNAEIQLEAQRVQQPNGYCYKYWRNTQKCIQESLERIKELQALMEHYNKVDEERAADYDSQANEWGDLEAQGRRYIAVQNGETPEETQVTSTPSTSTTIDTTVPTSRTVAEDTSVYNFNYNPQQQAQMTPQQFQYPTNPYQNNNMFMQQNPYMNMNTSQSFMGQQSFGMQNYNPYGNHSNGAYSFNWNGGGMQNNMYGQQYSPYGYQPQFGQQQQYGYWNNPYQAYSSYSVYGRTW